jgi:hypothetical protein
VNNQVLSYCQIADSNVELNGEHHVSFTEEDLAANLKTLYKSLGIDYSKFYKMDNMSKLGFLAIELMKSVNPAHFDFESDSTAVLLHNSDSSLDTDVKHQEGVNNAKASPAIFVYTLPNIVIGEISIRNKWYGESSFHVDSKPNIDFISNQLKVLTKTKKAKKVVIGWIDCYKENFKCKFALLDIEQEFTSKEILQKLL